MLAAHNGPAALQLAAAAHPNVILLDVVMPEMDGIEVCRRLKADPQLAAIPVILVTGRYEHGTVEGLDAGALDYIVKPVNGATLAARVRAAVRIKRSHDAVSAVNAQLREEVAQRNRTAEMLRHSHAELQAIYDGTADGLMIVDVETQNFLRVNAAMCSLLGYREEELLAMTIADLHPRHRASDRGKDSSECRGQRARGRKRAHAAQRWQLALPQRPLGHHGAVPRPYVPGGLL